MMEYTEEQRATVSGDMIREARLTGTVAMDSQLKGTMTAPKVFYEGGVSNPATKEELGLIKVGNNLTITEDGTLSAEVPTKASELENDIGYITAADIPVESVNGKSGEVNLTAEDVGAMSSDVKIPSATSDLTNDSGYITESALGPYAKSSELPTKTSDLTNDSGYITESTLEPYAKSADLPSKVTDLDNDAGYITESALTPYAKTADLPTKVSDLNNDANYITSGQAPVQSVNGQTGNVIINEPDPYELPVASSTQLGGVKPDAKSADMTTPVGVDAEGKLWVHAVADIESIGADKVVFEGNMVFTEQFGKYKPSGGKVTIPSDGKSWKGLLLDAYSEDKNPTITQPSIGVSSTTAKAYEVGTSVTPAYSGSFNVGKYEYGPATGVTVTTWSATNNVTNETKSTKSGTFAAYTVPDGSNYKITISGTYTDGAIPITALETEYPAGQIKGTTKTATTGAISGYRNSFYGTTTSKTAETTSAVIRALAQKSSKTLANGNSFTVNIPVGAQRVIIAYPATLRDITSIKDVNGLNADITSAFASSTVSVNGANNYTAINYKVYTLDFANPNDTANKYTVTI